PRIAPPRPATRCCCRRPVPVSTCSATTDIAAMCSPRPCTNWKFRNERRHHVLRSTCARAHAVRLGHHYLRIDRRPIAGGSGHGHLGFHGDRGTRYGRSLLFPRAAIHFYDGGTVAGMGGDPRTGATVGQIQSGAAAVWAAAPDSGADP